MIVQRRAFGKALGSRTLALAACLLTCVAGTALATPTVNGLFYGDGDDAEYVYYATSEWGSPLYIYYEAPIVYVALVVSREVNDNVFTPRTNKAYTTSAGWGPHRDAKRAVDSEYASFVLRCANNPLMWEWFQATYLDGGTWVSDHLGGAAVGHGTPPPSYTSASSFAYNINAYSANPAPAWDMYALGSDLENWTSPFDSGDPTNVVGLPGYPATGPITYSATHDWEWSQVYEWSVNLETAGCGDDPVFFVAGLSHHSPIKNGDPDQSDDFPPPPASGDTPMRDFGDLPDSYGTLAASDGARHNITVNGPFLGTAPDFELDGQPAVSADGDDSASQSDEDGVVQPVVTSGWDAGSSQQIRITATGSGVLGAWLDWNGDGDFDDAGEYFTMSVAAGVNMLNVTVGADFDYTTDALNARFRIFGDATRAPGGSLDAGDYVGAATNGEVEDYTFPIGTLPVTLSWFRASGDGARARFAWETATELGNVGFHVYGETPGGWARLNERLIPSRVVDSFEPQPYEASLPVGSSTRFLLADVDLNGVERRHGPFALGESHGARTAPDAVDWVRIRAEHDDKARARSQRRSRRPIGGDGVPIAELAVESDGLYRVRYEDLVDAGIAVDGLDAGTLALTRGGDPVSIRIEPSRGAFGPGSYFEFHGEAFETLYTRTNVYTLTSSRRLARRPWIASSWTPKPGAALATSYAETVEVDDNRLYGVTSPTDDPWYAERILAYAGQPARRDFQLEVDAPVFGDGAARLEVELWGVTDWPADRDHHVVVELNGTRVHDGRYDGREGIPLSLELPAGLLRDGANTVSVVLPGDTGVDYDLVNLDRYGATYRRAFVARDGRLSFEASGAAFRVEGLDSPDVVSYLLLGDWMIGLDGTRVEPADGGYAAVLPGSPKVEARYLVSTVDALGKPGITPARPLVDISSGSADYLVISHADFLDGLDPLVSARRAQGLGVRVVDVEDVYAQFGHGVTDPEAIREYLRHARRRMGVEQVLLVGGDTYDPLGYTGQGSVSFVPSLYVPTGELVRYSPSDPMLADLDEDGLPDLAMGRLPVRTSSELRSVVDKILAYPNARHERTAVFAADRRDGSLSFSNQSDALVDDLPAGWSTERAYIDALGFDGARDLLLDALDSGVALGTFFGHSSYALWSFERMFTSADAEGLRNAGRPSVIVQWGCWNTYHVDPSYDTLAHKLLLSGDRGAAAVIGAATLTKAASDREIGSRFLRYVTRRGQSVGSAMLQAKRDLARTNPEMIDVIRGWTLLGDPALVVTP